MIKNPVTLAIAAAAVLTTIAMTALSPVSASSYSASTVYLPAQIENHGTAIESVPADSFGDTGLSRSFPEEDPASMLDATPEMYS